MKIDCGKTENYFKYRKELCNRHSNCAECPLSHNEDGTNDACYVLEESNIGKVIEMLQKWVDENIHDDGKRNDYVNKPAHYTAGGIEYIDVIKASQDLEKICYYLDRLIECIEGGSQEEDETPKSMWIEKILGLICTCGRCGASRLGVSDYCPNCGAKMTR